MQVWNDPYLALEIEPASRLVRLRRSSASYQDLTTLRESLDQLNAQLKSVERAEYAMLQDLRDARGRNDEQFEAVMIRERKRMHDGFRKVAILVATQVGRLQVQRHIGQGAEATARVFLDEGEAVRWLLEK